MQRERPDIRVWGHLETMRKRHALSLSFIPQILGASHRGTTQPSGCRVAWLGSMLLIFNRIIPVHDSQPVDSPA
jgi:hypothetical protein